MSRTPSNSNSFARQAFNSLKRFLHIEAVSGGFLLVATALALLWANSNFVSSYEHLWHNEFAFEFGSFQVTNNLHFVINDMLMTIFFLVVGMEIKREMHDGALSDLKVAALPVLAALGGVVVPGLIYFTMNSGPVLGNGWAIPTATDIAFAVGVLALLGKSLPTNVRIFLLTLAIIDDIVAVLVIALFYSDGLVISGLYIAAVGIALVLLLQRAGVAKAIAYVIPGAIVWFGFLKLGVHPTLAGVVLGLLTPMYIKGQTESPIMKIPEALHPWVSFGIMPIFAFANAGVTFSGFDWQSTTSVSVMCGVLIALLIGKPVGVMLFSGLAVFSGVCRLPVGISWKHILLIGLLAGIGFTMSIFIAMLAFEQAEYIGAAKMGVLLGSLAAAISSMIWGRYIISLQQVKS